MLPVLIAFFAFEVRIQLIFSYTFSFILCRNYLSCLVASAERLGNWLYLPISKIAIELNGLFP